MTEKGLTWLIGHGLIVKTVIKMEINIVNNDDLKALLI